MEPTLSEGDIKFISKKTTLNKEKAILLTEDLSDRYLVFNEICERLRPNDLKKLSFSTSVFLTIFHKSLTTCFDINEKLLISKAIIEKFPEILNKTKIKLAPTKTTTNERQAFYFLVLYGLCDEQLTQFKDYYVKYLEDAFLRANKKDLAKHVDTWLGILRGIRKEGWFDICLKEPEPTFSIKQIKIARMVAPV
jgi:hypothetical protein